MLFVVGILLIALGLLSGSVLVLAALGVLSVAPGVTLWVTFPLLCLIGFGIVAAHARFESVRTITVVSSALLLLLAVVSIGSLVLGAAGFASASRSSASLWFVLAVSVVLGSLGAASFGRRQSIGEAST